MKKRLTLLLKIVIGIIISTFLILQIDFSQLLKIINTGNYFYLFIGILSFLIAYIPIQALRLYVLIKHLTPNLGFAFYISSFFGFFLPTNVGGDGIIIMYLKRDKGVTWKEAFALIFLSRIIGLFTLFLMGTIYIILEYNRLSEIILNSSFFIEINFGFILVFAFIAIILMITLIIRSEKYNKVKKFLLESFFILTTQPTKTYLYVFLYSIIFQGFVLVGYYFLLLFLNNPIWWFDLFLVLFVTAFMSLLPISIAALGVREATLAFFMVLFGASQSVAVAVAFLSRIITIIIALSGGILFLMKKQGNYLP